jgi:hypothetical protein
MSANVWAQKTTQTSLIKTNTWALSFEQKLQISPQELTQFEDFLAELLWGDAVFGGFSAQLCDEDESVTFTPRDGGPAFSLYLSELLEAVRVLRLYQQLSHRDSDYWVFFNE